MDEPITDVYIKASTTWPTTNEMYSYKFPTDSFVLLFSFGSVCPHKLELTNQYHVSADLQLCVTACSYQQSCLHLPACINNEPRKLLCALPVLMNKLLNRPYCIYPDARLFKKWNNRSCTIYDFNYPYVWHNKLASSLVNFWAHDWLTDWLIDNDTQKIKHYKVEWLWQHTCTCKMHWCSSVSVT